MGVLSYLRNTLRKGNSKTKEGFSQQRDSFYYNTGTSSYGTSSSRSRHYDHDTTDDDAEDGWDFGARQTPDRSMHSTTPSSFAASRILLNGDASRSSSAQSWHHTKPQAEAPVKQLPPTPSTDFEAEIEFYRRAANAMSTSNLEQMVTKEIASKSGTHVETSAPGRTLPQEGVVLVAAGTIAKETRLAEEKSAQRRKRAQSVAAAASEAPRPVLRHMSSAYSVKDAERRLQAAERSAMTIPPPPLPSSSSSSSGSSLSTVVSGSKGLPSSSSPSPSPADARGLGSSYKPRHTVLKAKRSMPQLEGVWEHFLEETAEDATALHARREAASGAVAILHPPIRRSSKQNLLLEESSSFSSSSLQSLQSESPPTAPHASVSRPPLPRHSSCPSTSSNLTIASVSSSKFSPSLSSLEMQEIIDGPRSPLFPPPHTLASPSGSAPMATIPSAPPSQRTIHQRRKHRSSNLMRISNPTSLSSTSSMTGSLFSSTGFSFDRMSASTMTTVQDDDETDKLDENEQRRTRDSELFSTPDQRVTRRLPEDLRIIPELYSRRGSPSSHQHHSSQSSTRQMRCNGTPSPSSILSFASHACSPIPVSNASGRYTRGPGSSMSCDSSSPALTPVGTPTPTTANFPITPPLSRSSSRSTPQLRQRRPSNASQAGGGHGVSPAAARNAVVWQRTPPLYPQDLPTECVDDDGDDVDDVDTLYFGFPRTPSSSKMILPQLVPSMGGKQSGGGNPGPLRRHMQRPSISDSSSEEQHSDLSYLRSPPVQPRNRGDTRDRMSLRSKSTTNLRTPPAALEDHSSMFTTTTKSSYDRSSMRHPPLPPLPVTVSYSEPVPPRSAPKNVQVARPPSRRTRSDSDAMSPYNSSTTSSSTTSLSSSSPRSSPLRHPIDSSTSSIGLTAKPAGRSSPARALPQRSPLSRSVDLPPRDRPSFDLAPAIPSSGMDPTRKPVEWGYAV